MEPNTQTQPPISETQLIEAVGTWADKNFGDRRGPEYGIIEEIGEACHCILKARQKIRGFDKPEKFQKEFTDALGDIIIYLSDWCYNRNAFFKFNRNLQQAEIKGWNMLVERRIISVMLNTAGVMMVHSHYLRGDEIPPAEIPIYNMLAQRICNTAEQLAACHNLDLPLIVATTWNKVCQRNWVVNPETAGNEG